MDVSSCYQRATALTTLPVKCAESGLYKNALLLGIGGHVHLYEQLLTGKHSEEWAKAQCKETLHCRCIHGFRAGPEQHLVVFGQKSIRILKVVNSKPLSLETRSALLSYEDWILDVRWFTQQNKCAFITSHNRVFIIDSIEGNILSCHASELNCILYSATLASIKPSGEIRQPSDILVLAGTVFNKVAVWRCKEDCVKKAIISHQLSGHNGVIFDIHIDMTRRSILSVSDDRTIKLWRWSHSISEADFSTDPLVQLEAVFRGHSARVWKAQFVGDMVISIGEDANIIVWNITGQIIKKVAVHKGKNIWSMAVSDQFLFTGGGDSSIKAWNLDHLLSNDTDSISGSSKSLRMLTPQGNTQDFPRSVCVINDMCVEITDKGHLKYQKLSECDQEVPLSLLTDDRLRGYTVMSGFELDSSHFLLTLGSTDGWICLITGTSSTDNVVTSWQQFHFGKVMSCHTLKRPQRSCYPLLLICWENGHMGLYEVKITANGPVLGSFHRMLLPKSKQRLIACVVLADQNYLLCADKMGSLYVYHLSTSDSTSINSLALPVETYPKMHGKSGITDMVTHESFLYTAGRDGFYCQFSFQSGQLSLVNENKIHRGFDWICKLLFCDDRLLVAGFHATDFVLFDVSLHQLVSRIECGGGHRSWDISLPDSRQLHFAYIKNKLSHVVSQPIPQLFTIVRPGMHAAKITACCTLTLNDLPYLITCSDDTTVKLSKLTHECAASCVPVPVSAMSRHISNVKCGCLTRSLHTDGSHVFISGGGRAQLVATLITGGANRKEPQLRFVCSIQLSDRYLLTRKQLKNAENLDPDTRIMAVTVVTSSSAASFSKHLIAAACSDGKIRFLCLDEQTCKFSLLLGGIIIEHCPLVLQTQTLQTGKKLLVLGSTDGLVRVYDVTNTCEELLDGVEFTGIHPELLQLLSHHQSGVNSLMVVSSSDTSLIVCTGGDDNCIKISEINTDNFSILKRHEFDISHSAQITGLVNIDGHHFISVSVDQRIILWERSGDMWSIKCVKCTTVADIAAVSYLEKSDLLISTGEGLEITRLNYCINRQ